MPTLKLNDISLYYEVHGSGDPLVLIAGLASDSQSWGPVIPLLARQFQLILFDNRGSCRTLSAEQSFSLSQNAADVRELLEYLEIPRAHLLGHSMGGYIAQLLAIHTPERVQRLILAGTSGQSSARNNQMMQDWRDTDLTPEQFFRNFFYWIYTPHFFENTGLVKRTLNYVLKYPYAQSQTAFSSQVDACGNFSGAGDLSQILAPTLVLCGNEDIMVPIAESRVLTGKIPGAQLTIIQNAAHAIHMEQPAEFVSSITDFLKQPVTC